MMEYTPKNSTYSKDNDSLTSLFFGFFFRQTREKRVKPEARTRWTLSAWAFQDNLGEDTNGTRMSFYVMSSPDQ